MSNRDKLRAATLGSNRVIKKDFVEWGGEKFELRQPTVGERREIRKRGRDEKGNQQIFEMLIWMVIFHTYVPDTEERVFDEADFEQFLAQPTGSWVDAFSEKALALLNVEVNELRKNLGRTSNAGSPSTSRSSSAKPSKKSSN